MILYVANLLCTDHAPITTATRLSSAEARALLLRTQEASIAPKERWRQASLGGTDFRQGGDDPAGIGIYANIHKLAGVSMDIAPVMGLGFWHEGGTAGDHWRDVQRRAANERDLVVEVAARCRDVHELPVVAETDSVSLWKGDPGVSYRRRIGYAVGFSESLRAGSLACYEARYEVLITGTAAQLDREAGPPPATFQLAGTLDAFSRFLNLLARLHGTMACERAGGAPSPAAPGRVESYRGKVQLLEGRLAEVSRPLQWVMNADGRSALRSLRRQLASERDSGIWNVDSSPIWGMGAWR